MTVKHIISIINELDSELPADKSDSEKIATFNAAVENIYGAQSECDKNTGNTTKAKEGANSAVVQNHSGVLVISKSPA